MSSSALASSTVVAVVGAGAMGAGIAQVAAAAGHRVKLVDSRPQAAQEAVTRIRAQFARLAEKGKMTRAEAEAAAARLSAVAGVADLADAGLVIEAIIEDLAAKQNLYRELEGLVAPNCIFATNTSSISITAIGAALKRPERLAGLHFFNPAPLMALVEVVSGLATAPEIAQTLFATANAWGKTAVSAKSTPGFIVNRVARPFYGEALRMVLEGAATPATLDACWREAGGFRMGPFELMDLIGLDVNLAVTRQVWQAFYHDPRFLPSLIQQELVDGGMLGKKSGRGFYDYRAGAAPASVASEAAQPVPTEIVIYGESALALALAARLHAKAIAFKHEKTHEKAHDQTQDNLIARAGTAQIYLTDGRTATRRARETGVKNTVLIDLALDYQKASRLAVSVAAQSDAASATAAIGLLQAAGWAVSRLADVAGLVVMRTVAMLVNEAADAVNQGVCDVKAVDAAMRLGVNYPCGPLAWADHLGVATISTVLTHLAQSYGEDRYRLSPLIQAKVFAGARFHD